MSVTEPVTDSQRPRGGSFVFWILLLVVVLAIASLVERPRSAVAKQATPTKVTSIKPTTDAGYPFNGNHEQFKLLQAPSLDEAVRLTKQRVLDALIGPAQQDHAISVGEVVVTNPPGPQTAQLKVWLEWHYGDDAIRLLPLLLSGEQPTGYDSNALEWVRLPSKPDKPDGQLAVLLPSGKAVRLICHLPRDRKGELVVVTMLVDRSGATERVLEYPIIMGISDQPNQKTGRSATKA
ncbi:MAG: hypothetical protein Q7S64_00540 [bacterium]|nr:hypothetical protein [bacterium]